MQVNQKTSILIVEDDPVSRRVMQAYLEKSYQVFTAEDAYKGLEILNKHKIALIITDLNMPGLSGKELIQKVTANENHPLIIVQTIVADIKIVIELMKEGVHDYFIKPVHPGELKTRVDHAVELWRLRLIKTHIEKENENRTNQILNWNLWKEQVIKRSIDKNDDSLIHSIRTNLSQGLGFGSLTTLVQYIQSSARTEGEHVIVDKSLMDMLYQNSDAAKNVIQMFDKIASVIADPVKLNKKPAATLKAIVSDVLKNQEKYIKINKHRVQHGDMPALNNQVEINEELFTEAIYELLINSYKFSVPESSVLILYTADPRNLRISIMNETTDGQEIADETHNLLFEPFFRLSRNVMEDYETLDFGLGLSFVDKVIRAHNAKIRISSMKTHLGKDTTTPMIAFEVEIPLITG